MPGRRRTRRSTRRPAGGRWGALLAALGGRARASLAALARRRPPAARFAWVAVALAALLLANVAYQVSRKPTELLGVAVPTHPKTPEETWAAYGDSFREHATDVVRPELLAALAQVESAGDPLARTYWRLRWSWNPLELYAPASSAVGLLQMTDGTFAEARRLCIRDHELAREGGWLDLDACRPNQIWFRTFPDHAIELTSAWLHASVVETLGQARLARVPLERRERLAAVVHLCGRGRAAAFVRSGFRARPGERCGDHDLAAYLARVARLEVTFALLAAAR